jgi:ATP-dependent Clp protease protease subunit
MRRSINALFRANARRGSFRAEAATNTIYVYDVIVGSAADAEWFGGVDPETFARALAAMSGPVSVRINSPGGDVFAGRAMAQAMRERGDVTAHVDGLAASAASILAVTAARCVMAPGALMMIHQAWTGVGGNADDLESIAALLRKIDVTLAADYAAKAGGDPAAWAERMAAETWFSADEALELGLADELATADAGPSGARQAAALWDLAAYSRAPAPAPAARTAEAVVEALAEIGGELAAADLARPERLELELELELADRRRRLEARLRGVAG